MKLITKIAAVSILTFSIATTACKKEKHEEEHNDNEIITTVELKFSSQGNPDLIYTWKDLDGDGGNAPAIDQIVLAPNTTYQASLKLLDETRNPAEDITEAIRQEDTDHRFYYTSGNSVVEISNLNNDRNGIPLGTTSTWTTGDDGNSTVNIVLRHYPQGGKDASDAVNSSKSSTDVDVSFNVSVE